MFKIKLNSLSLYLINNDILKIDPILDHVGPIFVSATPEKRE